MAALLLGVPWGVLTLAGAAAADLRGWAPPEGAAVPAGAAWMGALKSALQSLDPALRVARGPALKILALALGAVLACPGLRGSGPTPGRSALLRRALLSALVLALAARILRPVLAEDPAWLYAAAGAAVWLAWGRDGGPEGPEGTLSPSGRRGREHAPPEELLVQGGLVGALAWPLLGPPGPLLAGQVWAGVQAVAGWTPAALLAAGALLVLAGAAAFLALGMLAVALAPGSRSDLGLRTLAPVLAAAGMLGGLALGAGHLASAPARQVADRVPQATSAGPPEVLLVAGDAEARWLWALTRDGQATASSGAVRRAADDPEALRAMHGLLLELAVRAWEPEAAADEARFLLDHGGPPRVSRFLRAPGSGSVRGRVAPVGPVRVGLAPEGPSPGTDGVVSATPTEGGGDFTLRSVPPGVYRLVLRFPGDPGVDWRARGPGRVVVPEGASVEVGSVVLEAGP